MKNILPLLADIANGIFAVVATGLISNTEIVWWHFLIGIPFAMAPDLDAIPELMRRGPLGAAAAHPHDHREMLHYPLAFVVTGIGLITLVPFIGWLFLIATTLHFINDFYGTGWGVPILWPFSTARFKFLGRRVNRPKSILVASGDWDQLPRDERRLRLIVRWAKPELPSYISRWGMEYWVMPYYLRLNWVSGVEYALFGVSMLLLLFTLIY